MWKQKYKKSRWKLLQKLFTRFHFLAIESENGNFGKLKLKNWKLNMEYWTWNIEKCLLLVPMKKHKQKSKLPTEAEMRKTDKKGVNDFYIAHLYINGKTDDTEYEIQDELFSGAVHGVDFTKGILKLKCKSVPDNIHATLTFDEPLLKKSLFADKREVRIHKEKNNLEMYFYFESDLQSKYKFLGIYLDFIVERMQKDASKDKSGIFFEKNQMDYVPMLKGKPGETLNDLLNRLVKAVDKQMKKGKKLLLSELAQVKKDIKRNSIKWDS